MHSIEQVARVPPPGAGGPVSFAFSPDDRVLTFLMGQPDSLQRRLHGIELSTGRRWELGGPDGIRDQDLPLEERLRRERHRELGSGVTRYAWAKRADLILVPLPDGVHVVGGDGGGLHKVVGADAGPVLAPTLSPDGTAVAFVRNGELHTAPVSGGSPRQLTSGADSMGRTHGLAEFVAEEEMGRSSGYWWSWDGARLAVTEVDESHVPPYRIVHQGADRVDGAYEEHRYPFAGEANARVGLGIVPAEGGEVAWLDLGAGEDSYLARAGWMPDGALVAQVQDRSQTRLYFVRFDPVTWQRRELLEETSDTWVNLHDLFRPLEREGGELDGGFVWASERTGFRHLYLCRQDGSVVRPLTSGEWMVDSLDAVDEGRGVVYFSGTMDGVTERHLYVVAMDGGRPERITTEPGTHHVVADHGCGRFVDTHSAVDRQPTMTLRSLSDGEALEVIHDQPDPRVAELGLVAPTLMSFPAADGTLLHGVLHRPAAGPSLDASADNAADAARGEDPHPAIVSVYGGPHVQRAANSWAATCDMRAQHLRSLGYVVLVVDNRGSARRGLAFEAAIRHDLGNLEVSDQADGVRWLASQRLIDPGRVGIYGWSYGGYLAAMCLARAPDVFRAAVAGAPVTHWDGYDTHYAERYMGTPAQNPEGYERSSVMHHVHGIAGDLLLVHGLLDENVHFRHTARLVNALVKARKRYGLVLFPEERHLPRTMEDRVYMEERIRDFFQERL